jgi:hypothetical protein
MRRSLKYFCVAVMLLPVLALADNGQSLSAIQKQAGDAYHRGDYQAAIDGYLELTKYPDSGLSMSSLFYNISCCYSLWGYADEAFNFLGRAIEAGYDDLNWIEADPDFDELRLHHSERYQSFLESVRVDIQDNIVEKSPIAVITFDNYCGPTDLSAFAWDDLQDTLTDSLRRRFDLTELVSGGESEFDRFLLVLDWVSHQWNHNGNQGAKSQNALGILDEVAQGGQFRCVEYGFVLANCLSALGYPARVVGLQRQGVAFGSGKGHVCCEVWSNQFNKWVLLDGQNDAYWTHENNPLSAAECRQLMLSGKENELRMEGLRPEFKYDRMKHAWDMYFYHITVGTNYCFFTKPDGVDSRQYEFVSSGVKPELYFQGRTWNVYRSSDRNFMYPSLNRTHIHLAHPAAWTEPGDTLVAQFTHTAPWFDRFEMRLDNEDWRLAADSVEWVLHEGRNSLEVRTVNKMQRRGVESAIVVQNNLTH